MAKGWIGRSSDQDDARATSGVGEGNRRCLHRGVRGRDYRAFEVRGEQKDLMVSGGSGFWKEVLQEFPFLWQVELAGNEIENVPKVHSVNSQKGSSFSRYGRQK